MITWKYFLVLHWILPFIFPSNISAVSCLCLLEFSSTLVISQMLICSHILSDHLLTSFHLSRLWNPPTPTPQLPFPLNVLLLSSWTVWLSAPTLQWSIQEPHRVVIITHMRLNFLWSVYFSYYKGAQAWRPLRVWNRSAGFRWMMKQKDIEDIEDLFSVAVEKICVANSLKTGCW